MKKVNIKVGVEKELDASDIAEYLIRESLLKTLSY